jgi:diguanylate cyclase (GGDEF)-like protein
MEVFLDSQRDYNLHSQLDTLRRTLLASGGAFLYSLLILVCYWLGYVLLDAAELIMLFSCFWLGHLATVGFVYWRHKKKINAPSMTLIHMTWAIIFVSIVLYHTVEIRSSLMMAYLTILPFGAFRLKWRGFFGITLFTLASYAVVLFLFQQNHSGDWLPQVEVIIGVTFMLAMTGYCILGREFSILRERLTDSNQQLKVALTRIEELAITDELTGLYNRRHLFDHLDKQRAIANREGTDFVVGFIDLDKFKSINDQFGHRVGDDVLRQFSELLQESIREVDLVARYGGEEFVLLLNGVGIATAAVVVERIRSAVESLKFSEQQLAMTISVGITEYRAPETAKDTLERADKLLYQAKTEGRNRVVQDLVVGKLETAD